jgi:hypothetical protein
MFQTSLISLLYYPQLLSTSFVKNVTDIYHLHDCDLNSIKTWSPFSLFSCQTHPYTIYPCSRYTYLIILLCYLYLLSTKFCDECRWHLSSLCCDLSSMRIWSPFSLFSRQTHPCTIYLCSRYTYLIILQWLLLLWCVCFLPHLMGDLLLFP